MYNEAGAKGMKAQENGFFVWLHQFIVWLDFILNSSCSLASGFRNCWLCGKWREAKEISHISPLFPSLTLNMQSSAPIKAVFHIQFNGSYGSSDTHNMITEPNSNLPRETGNGSAPEMIYYFPYFANSSEFAWRREWRLLLARVLSGLCIEK